MCCLLHLAIFEREKGFLALCWWQTEIAESHYKMQNLNYILIGEKKTVMQDSLFFSMHGVAVEPNESKTESRVKIKRHHHLLAHYCSLVICYKGEDVF